MKRTTLRQSIFGGVTALLLLVSLGVAGTALADVLDPGGITSALPTVSVPTVTVAASPTTTAGATTTAPAITTPAVTTPAPTVAGQTLPTATVPAQTVSAPTQTLPAAPPTPAPLPRPPSVPASASATVTLGSEPSASAAVGAGPAHVAVGAAASPAGPSVKTRVSVATPAGDQSATAAATITHSRPSVTLATTGVAETRTNVPLSARPATAASAGTPALAAPAESAGTLERTVAPVTEAPFAVLSPGALEPGGQLGSSTAVANPALVSLLGRVPWLVGADRVATPGLTGRPSPASAPSRAPEASGRSSRVLGPHGGAVAGGVAALVALLGLGAAVFARSSASLGACVEVLRTPFPRFRILPCLHPSTATEAIDAASAVTPGQGSSSAGSRASASEQRGGRALPVLPPFRPRAAGAFGARFPTGHGWELLQTIVLAMLAAANAALLWLRREVGRSQRRLPSP